MGVKGGHFYIDEGVLQAIAHFAKRKTAPSGSNQESRLFAIPRQDDEYSQDDEYFHLGFRLQLPRISINTTEIETSVYRVVEFYPWDEPLPFTLPVV